LFPDGWPAGYGRLVIESTDSTMAEAARRAPGLAGPEWIMARRQTAARGRRGRAWAMPEGNFAATLVMRVHGGPAEAALRSFSAALALADAFSGLTGRGDAFALKWPNDVLLHGGKVAGILLESLPGDVLAIGFGVNLLTAPAASEVEPGAVRPVSVRESFGLSLAPEELLNALAAAFAGWEERQRSFGFAPIRKAWLSRAARLGQRVTARTGAEAIEGRFETVDEGGRLVLATAQGRRAVAAAEVFF
jgi:BirA family biotin operon repressor/biotin-[acetyl-CoA-carboxylase] ligase